MTGLLWPVRRLCAREEENDSSTSAASCQQVSHDTLLLPVTDIHVSFIRTLFCFLRKVFMLIKGFWKFVCVCVSLMNIFVEDFVFFGPQCAMFEAKV